MTGNKIAVWISFSRDSYILQESVSHFRDRFPDIECYVVDDPLSPVVSKVRRNLKSKGVNWMYSKSSRNRNLKGLPWIKEQCRLFLYAAKKSNAEVIVKIDSDTLVNNMDMAWEAMSDYECKMFGCSNPADHSIYGACNVTRVESYKYIYKKLGRLPKWCFNASIIPNDLLGEDVFVSSFLNNTLGKKSIKAIPLSLEGGWLSSYSYANSKIGLKGYVGRFSCVTFGDRVLANNDYSLILKEMKRFRVLSNE